MLLCALLALSLWLTAQRQVLGREEAQLFGYTLKAVETSAMEPALPQGGLAAVAASPSYELGDPVLCGDGTYPAGRRVDGDFIARGDGQGEEAEASFPRGHPGEGGGLVPGGAGVYGFLSSWWGPPAVLAAGALLLSLPALLGWKGPGRPAQKGQAQGRHARRD